MPSSLIQHQLAVEQASPAKDLRALLALDDAEFVASAYLTLLRRPADEEGFEHYLRKLRAGFTKLELIASVCESSEGRSKGRLLPGLDKAMRHYGLTRIPVLGAVYRRLAQADGYSANDRRLRAVEQSLLRQERAIAAFEARMLDTLAAIQSLPAQATDGPARSAGDPRLVQPRGQTPSVIADFIRLRPGSAKEVIGQLSELVGRSLEAERLAATTAAASS